jgi:hypothetical protein
VEHAVSLGHVAKPQFEILLVELGRALARARRTDFYMLWAIALLFKKRLGLRLSASDNRVARELPFA